MKKFSSAAVLLTLVSATAAQAKSSFRDIQAQVYDREKELKQPPQYGASTLEILGLLAKAGLGFGALADRARFTFLEHTDIRPESVKIFHPMGTCAEGDWVINASSGASGLLTSGTQLRAIVRLSSADAQAVYDPTKTRKFGVAIKLFPNGGDESKPVTTVNLFTLDQASLEGSKRASFITPDSPADPLYFVNKAPATSDVTKSLTKVLGNLKMIGSHKEFRPDYRPIYPITSVTAAGESIAPFGTPDELQFVPHVDGKIEKFDKDFRIELAAAKGKQIYFDILTIPHTGEPGQLIGRLTLGKLKATQFCDQQLHFHHHPNNRAIGN